MNKKVAWDGKTRGGLIGYQIFFFILKNLGLVFAYFILIFVAFYFLLFSFKSTKASYHFHRKIMGSGTIQSILNVYQGYHLFGQAILDKVAILAGLKGKFTTRSNGLENLYEIVEKKQGAFLLSAHLGNWEIAGHFLTKLNVPINIVLYNNEHEQIKKMLESVQVKKNFKVISYEEDFSHLIAINKAIASKEIVCIHGDRSLGGRSKVAEKTFMGQTANFPLGPFSIVSKMKAPYCIVFGMKTAKFHYDFFAFSGKNVSGKTEDILEEYVQKLEEMLKQYPKQWYNYYKYWND